ncbi:uncharacterized protein [Drosophila kikkawai]|uniref:Uncharacterized protein isoform X1 n=1 Tax=Drosophila kikkawai TaxID=30033 RepID=A0A6P4J6D4_DROKI|nr:uncharacterized protein LOC108080623 isoform X1 [Drosophila kikkawai]
MESLTKYRYGLVAGAFAAGGSFFGKLPSHLSAQKLLNASESTYLEIILMRAVPLALMLLCNVSNLRCFLKALQMTEQTLTCVVLTAASNYVLSFVLGALVYGEPLTVVSGLGITLILSGLWFLCDAGAVEGSQKEAEKEE